MACTVKCDDIEVDLENFELKAPYETVPLKAMGLMLEAWKGRYPLLKEPFPVEFETIYDDPNFTSLIQAGAESLSMTRRVVMKNDWIFVSQIVPNAPTGLLVDTVTDITVTLTWTDNSLNEEYFVLERSNDGGVTWNEVGTVVASETEITDTGLTPSTSYLYRVLAKNSAGDSGFSNQLTVTTNSS